MVVGEVEELAGRFEALDDFFVGQAGVAQGDDFVHGHESVGVDIGGFGLAGLFGRCRILLCLGRGFGDGLAIFLFDGSGVGGDDITASGTDDASDDRSEQTVVRARDGCSGGRSGGTADGGSLLFSSSRHRFAAGEQGGGETGDE